jgi:hypothetical protein
VLGVRLVGAAGAFGESRRICPVPIAGAPVGPNVGDRGHRADLRHGAGIRRLAWECASVGPAQAARVAVHK